MYWNPRLKTDENGCATIDYYNGRNATYMNVDVETLVDDKPAAVNTLSILREKGSMVLQVFHGMATPCGVADIPESLRYIQFFGQRIIFVYQ